MPCIFVLLGDSVTGNSKTDIQMMENPQALEFEITGTIMNLIDKFNCEILNQNYLNNGTEITLEIPTQNSTIFEKEISKNNQIVIKRIGS